MTLPDLKDAVDILQFVGLAVMAAIMWLRKPGEDAIGHVKVVRDEVNAHYAALNTRITTVEETLKHMPNDRDLGEVREAVSSMRAQIVGLHDLMKPLNASMARIEQWMLHNK